MTRIFLLLIAVLLTGCATLGIGGKTESEHEELWKQSHLALYGGNFARAESGFSELARRFPETGEGQEALFFLAVVSLDPRNPQWDPAPAREQLQRYLARDSSSVRLSYPRPEARTLLELTEQLVLPPQERAGGLASETRVVRVPGPERVVVPATQSRALTAEVERLRREVAERDETIRRQREELNRIRNALTPRQP